MIMVSGAAFELSNQGDTGLLAPAGFSWASGSCWVLEVSLTPYPCMQAQGPQIPPVTSPPVRGHLGRGGGLTETPVPFLVGHAPQVWFSNDNDRID